VESRSKRKIIIMMMMMKMGHEYKRTMGDNLWKGETRIREGNRG
jgi:hypothetical protein